MNKIASFLVDHTNLPTGFYASRYDIHTVTFDFRFVSRRSLTRENGNIETVPDWFLNSWGYSQNIIEVYVSGIHSIEHLLATVLRDLYKEDIVYFGPGGCLTMYYLVTNRPEGVLLESLHKDWYSKLEQAIKAAYVYLMSEGIPGTEPSECGNPNLHSKLAAQIILEHIIRNYATYKMEYPEEGK